MRKIPIALFLLACATLWALYSGWADAVSRTPETLIASVDERLAQDEPDYESALHEIELALRLAEGGDAATYAEALQRRAEVLRARGALVPAMNDYKRILSDYLPGDVSVLLTLANLQHQAGDLVGARETTDVILKDIPQHPAAWALIGRIYASEADEALAQAYRLVENNLDDEDAETARKLAGQIAARTPDDPSRVARENDLRAYFGPMSNRDMREIDTLLDRASEFLASAREAYSFSMQRRADPNAMRGFLDILYVAGHYREAVSFGHSAMAHSSFRKDRDAIHTLASSLHAMGAARDAGMAIQTALQAGRVPTGYLDEWLRILYDGESWKRLTQVARFYIDRHKTGSAGRVAKAIGSFYTGMSDFKRRRLAEAMRNLELYYEAEDVEEPFPGADLDALSALADMARQRGAHSQELKWLRAALELDPLLSGDAWLRVYRLINSKNVEDLAEREAALTHAIRLSPELADAHDREWIALGRNLLSARKRDPNTAGAAALRAGDAWYPEDEFGAYELFLLARLHREAGESQGAVVCLNRLLFDFPGLRAAMDELIDIYSGSRRNDDLIPLVMERLERWGPNPRCLQLLRSFPERDLSLDQHWLRMRLDPLHSGAMAVARALADDDQPERALRALTHAGFAQLGSEGRILAAELYLSLDRHDELTATLFPIPPDDELYSRASALRIRSALAQGDDTLLMGAVRELVESRDLAPEEVLSIADHLLLHDQPRPASFLLTRLDRSPGTRSGRLFLRQAALHMNRDEAEEAVEDLERAEAYLADGSAALGRLLLAIQGQRWLDMPEEISRLRGSQWRPSLLQQACLLALEDRLESARGLFQQALATEEPGPLWMLAAAATETMRGHTLDALPFRISFDRDDALTLLTGVPGRAEDARSTLGLILALEDAHWRSWVPPQIERIQARAPAKSSPNPWLSLLAANAYLRQGRMDKARAAALQSIATRRDFEPGWTLHERLEEGQYERKDHPELLRLRQQRREALLEEETLPEGLLLEARELQAQGKINDALLKAKWAVRESPRFASAHLLLAELHEQADKIRGAISNYENLFAMLPPEQAQDLIPPYLELLDEFRTSGRLSMEDWRTSVLQLVTRQPNDPRALLAAARSEILVAGDQNVPTAVGRAWHRMDAFLEAHPGIPLDDLRPGATREWFDFTSELDPRRAEALVRGQLLLRPNSPDLWLMLGQSYEGQYRQEDALAVYRQLLDLLPEPDTLLRCASLMADLSHKASEVQALLDSSIDLNNWELDDPAIRYIFARAYANGGPQLRDLSIQILGDLWHNREQLPEDLVEPDLLGQLYGAGLLRRGYEQDRDEARTTLETVLPWIDEPVRRDLVRAMSNLANFLPTRPDQDAPQEVEGAPSR